MPLLPTPPKPYAPARRASGGRDIQLIVIHCSASPNGRRVTSEEIDAWHQARGFARNPALIGANEPKLRHIGYHYVIYAEGATRIGRGEREPGAHCQGYNRNSIGICLVGTDQFGLPQWDTLKGLVSALALTYPQARIVGHRDLSPDQNQNGFVEPFEWLKTCPGFSVADWRAGGMEPLKNHVLEPRT